MSILANDCYSSGTGITTYLFTGDAALTPVVSNSVKCKSGIVPDPVSTTQVISHNLGFIPDTIKIVGNTVSIDGSTSYIYTCNGIYSKTDNTNICTYKGFNPQSGSGTNATRIYFNASGSGYISNVTASSFTIIHDSLANFLTLQLLWSIDYI